MKNYDLSQYVLRAGNAMIFPLTQEEVAILCVGEADFSKYIRMPYFAKSQKTEDLQKLANSIDMENEYWFLNTLWVSVDIKARAIIGYLRLEQVAQFNKIIFQVTDDKCESITRDDVLELFYKFLTANNYYNIVYEDIDKKAVANEG